MLWWTLRDKSKEFRESVWHWRQKKTELRLFRGDASWMPNKRLKNGKASLYRETKCRIYESRLSSNVRDSDSRAVCVLSVHTPREREWEATGLKQQWLCDLDVWLEKISAQLTADTQGLAWAFYMQLCLLDSTCSLLSWFEGTNPVRWGSVDIHRSARLESCLTSPVNMRKEFKLGAIHNYKEKQLRWTQLKWIRWRSLKYYYSVCVSIIKHFLAKDTVSPRCFAML